MGNITMKIIYNGSFNYVFNKCCFLALMKFKNSSTCPLVKEKFNLKIFALVLIQHGLTLCIYHFSTFCQQLALELVFHRLQTNWISLKLLSLCKVGKISLYNFCFYLINFKKNRFCLVLSSSYKFYVNSPHTM